MDLLKALFFLVFGIGLVAIALQGIARGSLPMGSRGLHRGEPASRDEQPAVFWLLVLLYGGGGLALAVYAVKLLLVRLPG